MAGTSKEHSIIIVNLTGEFHSALRSKVCQPFSSDLRVKVSANGLYAYPDLTIVCGPIDVEDEQDDVLLNPTLIIEVFSPGTERYDRGKKFDLYRELDSLKEYVLVSQDQYRVEQFLRGNGSEWGYRVAFKEDDIFDFKRVYLRKGCLPARGIGSSRGVVGIKEKTGPRIRPVFCVGEIVCSLALLHNAKFGAAIQCPCLLVAGGICWHFTAKAYRLNPVCADACVNERLANSLGAAFTEAPVVFLCAALVGEAGDDEALGGILHRGRDLLHFGGFRGFHGVAVVAETHR